MTTVNGTNVWGEPVQIPAAEIEVTVAVQPKRYSKRLIFGEMTDAEYETYATVAALQPPRMREVFNQATELSEADPDFASFQTLMVTNYGAPRAAAILAAAEIV